MKTEMAKRVGGAGHTDRNCKKYRARGVQCDRKMAVKLKGNFYKPMLEQDMLRGGNVGYNDKT